MLILATEPFTIKSFYCPDHYPFLRRCVKFAALLAWPAVKSVTVRAGQRLTFEDQEREKQRDREGRE